jgi:UDP-3-O-acyl-N-acetylglucosamine deacetylase
VRVSTSPALRIDVPRRTTLESNGVRVEMIEHILAALAGLQIDNCEVWVNAAEMPGCDGSAIQFVEALDRVEIVEQDAPVHTLLVDRPIRVGDAEGWIEARPPRSTGLSISFELDYGPQTAIGLQSHSIDVTPKSFRTELASCRTFILEEVAQAMVAQGIGKRVTPRDLLIFGRHGLIENRLRFPNECVRHKVLDVIGDLALTGCSVIGHIVAFRSGHRLHAELATQLLDNFAVTSGNTTIGAERQCA